MCPESGLGESTRLEARDVLLSPDRCLCVSPTTPDRLPVSFTFTRFPFYESATAASTTGLLCHPLILCSRLSHSNDCPLRSPDKHRHTTTTVVAGDPSNEIHFTPTDKIDRPLVQIKCDLHRSLLHLTLHARLLL